VFPRDRMDPGQEFIKCHSAVQANPRHTHYQALGGGGGVKRGRGRKGGDNSRSAIGIGGTPQNKLQGPVRRAEPIKAKNGV